MVLSFAFVASAVIADPSAPVTLTPGVSTSRDLSSLPAQTADARGGNVTQININALTVTNSWQGYYGNVTGVVTLQDGSNNTFYNWSLTTVQGEVYATRASSIAWANTQCANASQITDEQTYLGQTATDSDSVTNTFASNTHPAFSVSTKALVADNCSVTYGYVNNNSQSSDFVMVLLQSGANIIYGTLLNDSVTGFNGQTYDFELLVGENEKTGNLGVTPYYFWVELG